MKHFLLRAVGTVIIIVLINSSGFCQYSLGIQTGLAKPNEEDAEIISGGGLNLRYFTSKQMAFGVAAKIYGDKAETDVLGQSLRLTEKLIPVTATFDYYLLTGLIRPYVGGDAGVYFTRFRARVDGSTVSATRRGNPGVAPRVGVLFAVGRFGIQVEGIYNFVFGNRNHGTYNGQVVNMEFKSTSEYGGVNVGVVFGLGEK